jgi:hypothetical protein
MPRPASRGIGQWGGSDGLSLRVVDTSRPFRVLLPDLRPALRLDCSTVQPRARYAASRSTIPSDQWPAIVAAVQANGVRATARVFGASYEAVRQLVRALGHETAGVDRSAERDQRIRDHARAVASWTQIADRFGMSASGVRYVCRDLPARQGRKGATASCG